MRFALALALATVGLAASAAHAQGPKPPVVWQNRVLPAKPAPAGIAQFASVSHKLYLNDCRPNGCSVAPGNDSSLLNRSSIPDSSVVLSPYPHGAAHWGQLVQCVRDTFAPFNVQIVTSDPGPSVSHFEVMIGGSSKQLNPDLDAGGVAPFISCGAQRNNIISFVFPEGVTNLNYLCGAVAQEASHVWGLDHELNKDDPMTYLDLGSLKRFQDADASCGESTARECACGGQTQNSFQYLADTFGPKFLQPAALAITAPTEGEWVKPGFPVHAALTSQLSARMCSLSIDDMQTQSLVGKPDAFTAPADLPGGDHKVTVTATDAGERTLSASVDVHVTAACGASARCAQGFHCLGAFCLPGGDVEGGLGAACTSNEQCITGACATDGTDTLCTGRCDAGSRCPSGFECIAGNVCWPGGGDGCSASGGSPGLALLGASGLVLALRRRRR
ncbi:MAG TPA: MYXO-CTERM sorting domain-containing protein [Kofleriaceae bacterium]|nr:MYXO-CTERM sorting domain-containing protein [Kofleriaceae bacterium]